MNKKNRPDFNDGCSNYDEKDEIINEETNNLEVIDLEFLENDEDDSFFFNEDSDDYVKFQDGEDIEDFEDTCFNEFYEYLSANLFNNVEYFDRLNPKDKVKYLKNNPGFLEFLFEKNFIDKEVYNEIVELINLAVSKENQQAPIDIKRLENETKRLETLVSLPILKTKPNSYHDAEEEFKKGYYDKNNLFEKVAKYIYVREEGYVRKENKICYLLVGEPGVGKTQFAKSFAKALGFPFIYINLCNNSVVSMKGTSKQYVQSDVGYFVKSYINSKVKNPVILFDEIDKAGGMDGVNLQNIISDVLDTNSRFCDNFLEVGIDLSNCIFILTANNISLIPDYLKDRSIVVKFNPYTIEEKKIILKNQVSYSMNEQFDKFQFELDDRFASILANSVDSIRTAKKILEDLIYEYIFETTIKTQQDMDINLFLNNKLQSIVKKQNKTYTNIGFLK